MKKIRLVTLVLIAFAVAGSTAYAHMLWLNVNNYTPSPGEVIYLEIGFGHKFPADEAIKDGRIDRVYAVTPSNEEVDAEKVFPGFYKFKTTGEGVYRFHAALKSGFMSTTATGRKMGNKKTLEDVVSCFAFQISGQAIVYCGNVDKKKALKPINTIDILPVKTVEKSGNKNFTVKAMFKDNALSEAKISGVCLTCPIDEEKHWTTEVTADQKGEAVISSATGGPWMFMIRNKVKYEDTTVCDDFMYCTTVSMPL